MTIRRGRSAFFDPKFRANRKRWQVEAMLGEWYGEDCALERITGFTEEPRSVGNVVRKLLSEKLSGEALTAMTLRERWSSILGAPLDRLTRLGRLEEHCAYIEVAHPAILMELKRSGKDADWCRLLNRNFPDSAVESVCFIPASQEFPR